MIDVNNYKVFIINESGKLKHYISMNGRFYHIDGLKDYIYEKYQESDLWRTNDSENINDLIRFLNDKNEIVYLHSNGYGLLSISQTINDKQKDTLYKLFDNLKDTPIYINTVNSGMFCYINGLKNTELLDEYFKEEENGKSLIK